MPDYDLILRNGTIVDGSGAATYIGDLAIAGDRITGVGTVAASAKTEIDVSRLAIAPGFVDVHSHDDAAVVRDPAVDFKIMQGVTTDVIGNCGAGVAPTTDAFRQFYARGLGPILHMAVPDEAHDLRVGVHRGKAVQVLIAPPPQGPARQPFRPARQPFRPTRQPCRPTRQPCRPAR